MALTEPTFTAHCTRCGKDTTGSEVDAERKRMGCHNCGMTLTVPYFSDQQMQFFLICGILAVIVIFSCLALAL